MPAPPILITGTTGQIGGELLRLFPDALAPKRRLRVTTTDSAHNLPIAPNLLNRNCTPAAPNQTWADDITYIVTEEGWSFLTVVIDLFSRRVVGWSMQPDMRRNLIIDALEMAWFQRRPDQNIKLIFHSDRGSQYASDDFNKALKEYAITPSLSCKGNCWDNACSKTLFGSLKVERCTASALEPSVRLRMKPSRGCSGITKHACTRHCAQPAQLNSKRKGKVFRPKLRSVNRHQHLWHTIYST